MKFLFKNVAGFKPEGLQLYLKKDYNSCFTVKSVNFLRAPIFKEHLRTTACESKPLRCIVFTKTMAVKFYLIIIYSYFFTPDLTLQS